MRVVKIFLIGFCVVFFHLVSAYCAEIACRVANHNIADNDYIELESADLLDGAILIEGTVSDGDSLATVKISFDYGQEWNTAEGVASFRYSFVPSEGVEYPVLIALFGADDAMINSRLVVIKYFTVNLRREFEMLLQNIRDDYIDERSRNILGYFDEERYPDFDSFSDNLKKTFDENSLFNLDIQVRSIRHYNGMVFVYVDWNKTFELTETQSGKNNEIHFNQVNGQWKICYIEDDSLFIVGSGLLIFGNK